MSDLQRLLFHDKFEKREKWFRLFEDEVWTPRYNIDLPAQRALAYQQLSCVAQSGIVSVRNFFDDPTNIFTAHEMLGTISASTSTKFTVHYNLFGTTHPTQADPSSPYTPNATSGSSTRSTASPSPAASASPSSATATTPSRWRPPPPTMRRPRSL